MLFLSPNQESQSAEGIPVLNWKCGNNHSVPDSVNYQSGTISHHG